MRSGDRSWPLPVEPGHQLPVDLAGGFGLVGAAGERVAGVDQLTADGLDPGPQGVIGDQGSPPGHLSPDLFADGLAQSPLQHGEVVSEASVLGFGVLEVGAHRRPGDPSRGRDRGGEPVGAIGGSPLDLGPQLRVVIDEPPADRRPTRHVGDTKIFASDHHGVEGCEHLSCLGFGVESAQFHQALRRHSPSPLRR